MWFNPDAKALISSSVRMRNISELRATPLNAHNSSNSGSIYSDSSAFGFLSPCNTWTIQLKGGKNNPMATIIGNAKDIIIYTSSLSTKCSGFISQSHENGYTYWTTDSKIGKNTNTIITLTI